MNKEQSDNKSVLSEIPGGFAIMPNALIGFISNNACAVFLKIYQCQFASDSEEYEGQLWAKLSTPCMAVALNQSKNTISMALKELIEFGFVKHRSKNRNNTFYTVDWNEVNYACGILCSLTRKGQMELLNICVGSNFDPSTQVRSKFDRISNIDHDTIDDLIEQYPNTSKLGQKMTELPSVGSNFDPSTQVRSKFDRNNESSVKNSPNFENVGVGSKNDRTIEGDQNELGQILIEKSRVGSNFDRNEAELGQILTTEIYKEKNKKEMRERSSQYIGEKEEKLLEYFSSRNLELPVFDKTLYESFLETDLDDSDDDVVKGIKTVWNQLGYDEELPDNNFIDLGTFQNILFHSWEQLKQDYPDYSLSEEEFKNIFGFIILEHEGEPCLYIDPSKLQDVTTNSQPIPEKRQNYKFSDRTSRRLFIDCINEIADKDDQLLTTSEFVALLLIDYATEHSSSAFSVELTKLSYEDLLKDLSERANIPVEDIRWLFKELPQKHKVKISPQQLLPDKFFKYNQEHGEESKVEELLRNRLEEV